MQGTNRSLICRQAAAQNLIYERRARAGENVMICALHYFMMQELQHFGLDT